MQNKYLLLLFYLLTVLGLTWACSKTETTPAVIPQPKPTATFTYSVNTDNPLDISYNVSVKNAKDFLLDFGDGTSQKADTTQKTISHTYPKEGSYEVSLTATQNQLQSDIFKQSISVKDLVLNPTFAVKVADDTVSVTNTTQNLPSNAIVEVIIDGKPITGYTTVLADGSHSVSIKITTKTNKVFESASQSITTKKKEIIKYLGGNKDWPYVSEIRNGEEYYVRFILLDPDKDLFKSSTELKGEGKVLAAHILDKYNSIIVKYSPYDADRFDNFQELIEHMKNGPQWDQQLPNRLVFSIQLKQDPRTKISIKCEDSNKAIEFLKNITWGTNIKVNDIFAVRFALDEPMFQRYGVTNTSVGFSIADTEWDRWVTLYNQ